MGRYISIAHRGNTHGPNKAIENSPAYVDDALSRGFDVEIDLWFVSGALMLGHDGPEYQIQIAWLNERGAHLWVHCKNLGALEVLSETSLNYFFHESDPYTLTSKGFVWTYPGKDIGAARFILVHLGKSNPADQPNLLGAAGFCGDYVGAWG